MRLMACSLHLSLFGQHSLPFIELNGLRIMRGGREEGRCTT